MHQHEVEAARGAERMAHADTRLIWGILHCSPFCTFGQQSFFALVSADQYAMSMSMSMPIAIVVVFSLHPPIFAYNYAVAIIHMKYVRDHACTQSRSSRLIVRVVSSLLCVQSLDHG